MSKQKNKSSGLSVIIAGASGFVGRELIKHIARRGDISGDINCVGAISSRGSTHCGKDIGALVGLASMGIEITDNIDAAFSAAPSGTALIDFSLPEASLALAPAVAAMGSVYVVGTTGHGEKTQKAISTAAKKIPIIQSSNMSIALTILGFLVEEGARLLNKEAWDISITERHRKDKKDSPSGTAKMLAAMMNSNGKRNIEIISSRRSDIIGEHDIYFDGASERIILSHHAHSRQIFAAGAVEACLWGITQAAGLYTMRDVVGLDKKRLAP